MQWTYLGDDGWKVTSTQLDDDLGQHQVFWVKLQGPGIQVCGVFDGSGELAGTGNYQIDSKSWQTWSPHAHRPALLGSGLTRL